MTLLLLSLLLPVVGGLLAPFAGRNTRRAGVLGAGACIAGSTAGVLAAAGVLFGAGPIALSLPWAVPLGAFTLQADGLSAVFLLPAYVLFAAAALYGARYLEAWTGERRAAWSWLFFDLLMAAIVLVLSARNGVLFLVAWEVMSLTSYFLVVFEDERAEVRRAGWTYLVATHIGTAFLLVLFLLLGHGGAPDFRAPYVAAGGVSSGAMFLLGLVGFGTKAGLVPAHIWLPEAHPAAPSHVSAVLSGVMIETGIYGLLRVLLLLGAPAWWWGALLVLVGGVSALGGILAAGAQQDLKRLLAYSSIENVGVLALAIGVGLLGMSTGSAVTAVLGFAAALFHAVNHTLFKGLLFLGAGSIRHGAGTLELDRLGGLLRRMGDTGTTFLIGALAGVALPPLNGFASEFFLYSAGLALVTTIRAPYAWPGLLLVGVLALTGAVAAAVYAKAFGVAFLGRPRGAAAASAHEAPRAMRIPMHVLALLCVVLGVFPSLGMLVVVRPVLELTASLRAFKGDAVTLLFRLAWWPTRIAVALLVFGGVVGLLRRGLLHGRPQTEDETWGCGYEGEAAPRAQYTGSSLLDPLLSFFRPTLSSRRAEVVAPEGFHPEAASLASETPDLFRSRLYQPLFERIEGWLGRARGLQRGGTHLYLLYIFAALIVLLVLAVGWLR